MNRPPNAFSVDAISLTVPEHFLVIFNPDFYMYLHDNRIGLNDNMVDVASPSRLDGATLGAYWDPQSHLRSTIAKLKASLWVPCCIDATAERLKIGKNYRPQ